MSVKYGNQNSCFVFFFDTASAKQIIFVRRLNLSIRYLSFDL
jgi:hypothetical protein